MSLVTMLVVDLDPVSTGSGWQNCMVGVHFGYPYGIVRAELDLIDGIVGGIVTKLDEKYFITFLSLAKLFTTKYGLDIGFYLF